MCSGFSAAAGPRPWKWHSGDVALDSGWGLGGGDTPPLPTNTCGLFVVESKHDILGQKLDVACVRAARALTVLGRSKCILVASNQPFGNRFSPPKCELAHAEFGRL